MQTILDKEDAVTDVEKSNLFNRFFASVYNVSSCFGIDLDEEAVLTPTRCYDFDVSVDKLSGIMQKLKVSKSGGQDCLPVRLFRECRSLAKSLHLLFRTLKSEGKFPFAWKE